MQTESHALTPVRFSTALVCVRRGDPQQRGPSHRRRAPNAARNEKG